MQAQDGDPRAVFLVMELDAVDAGLGHVTSVGLRITPRKARVQGPRERGELNCQVLRTLQWLSETL